jgi:hypothetical protein
MMKIYIRLNADESEALYKLAHLKRRDNRSQAELLIRNGLQRLGLLPIEDAEKINPEYHFVEDADEV